jgi:hypothetical protein
MAYAETEPRSAPRNADERPTYVRNVPAATPTGESGACQVLSVGIEYLNQRLTAFKHPQISEFRPQNA